MWSTENRYLQEVLDSLDHLGGLEVLGHPTEKTHNTSIKLYEQNKVKKYLKNSL